MYLKMLLWNTLILSFLFKIDYGNILFCDIINLNQTFKNYHQDNIIIVSVLAVFDLKFRFEMSFLIKVE